LIIGALLQAWLMGLIGRRFVVSRLLCDSEGEWSVVISGGVRQTAKIDPSARVGSKIIWLVLVAETRRIHLLLLPSTMPDTSWRGLQTRLRWLSDKSPDRRSDQSGPQ
jgi:hypothetical protein